MSKPSRFIALMLSTLVFGAPSLAFSGTYFNFDIPGASEIFPQAINNSRAIVGRYLDGSGQSHSFVRSGAGGVMIITIPAATTMSASGINSSGRVAGYYYDSNSTFHGFLRDLSGQITVLDAPGAGVGLGLGTLAYSINDAGQIAGMYTDPARVPHGYIRAPDGSYTVFDISSIATVETALINASGQIGGAYFPGARSGRVVEGYMRDMSGGITLFSATRHAFFTFVVGINATGECAGYYEISSGLLFGSFLRDASGNITLITVPGSTSANVLAIGIADNGSVVGIYRQSSGTWFGWIRDSDGIISSFKDPAVVISGDNGTFPTAVSGNGTIAGYYVDHGKRHHGFILTH